MFSNSSSLGGLWVEPMLVLLVVPTVLIVVTIGACRRAKNARQQQSIWQVVILSLILLVGLELTGIGGGAISAGRQLLSEKSDHRTVESEIADASVPVADAPSPAPLTISEDGEYSVGIPEAVDAVEDEDEVTVPPGTLTPFTESQKPRKKQGIEHLPSLQRSEYSSSADPPRNSLHY